MENAELLLRALRRGLEIELDGQRYQLVNNRLCIVADRPAFGERPAEEVLVEADMSINQFLGKADALPEEQAFGLISVLTHLDVFATRH